MKVASCLTLAVAAAPLVLGCGSALDAGDETRLERALDLQADTRTDELLSGTFASEHRVLELSARATAPFAVDVVLRLESARFDAHLDYERGQLVIDGHGAGLDRPALGLLARAASALADGIDAADATADFPRRALYAAVVSWQQSGGMALGQLDLSSSRAQPGEAGTLEKSRSDDGIQCVRRGRSYDVSFDYGNTTVRNRSVRVNAQACNGLCGPDCAQLGLAQMWTLDCLEHDECCKEAGSSDCWAPVGQCGDEYGHATADFLRGLDPFSTHCAG